MTYIQQLAKVAAQQELPAIFKPNPANNKPFFEDVGELIGGVKSLVPTSKDLGEGLGTTTSNYLKRFKKPPAPGASPSVLAGLANPYPSLPKRVLRQAGKLYTGANAAVRRAPEDLGRGAGNAIADYLKRFKKAPK